MLVVRESGLLLNLGRSDRQSLEDLANVGALLHRNDAELVLLVHPDEERLRVVVEDTAGLGPLAFETARLKILVASLEKEVVGNELLTVGLRHGAEGVVLALELSSELVEGGDYFLLDLTALLRGDRGAERVIGEVASHADPSRVDHFILVSREVWALELGVVHAADVLVRGRVLVIVLNDLVEEWGKGVVALVAARVHTDARLYPFATGEDALLEGEAILILLVLALVPDIARQHLGQERFRSTREVREALDFCRGLQVRSHHHAVNVDCGGGLSTPRTLR